MKKVLSVLFCLLMLFSAMSVMGVSAEEKNIVVNPGFEDDLNIENAATPWDKSLTWTPRDFSWCKIESTTEEAHSGQKSMKVSERTQWWATGYQIGYTFAKKETITFSVWVKVEKGAGERLMRFGICDKNGNDIIAMLSTDVPQVFAVDYEWREIKGTFTPPSNMKDCFVGIAYQPTDTNDSDQMNWRGAFYVDDVYISSASGSTSVGAVATTTTTKKAENTTTTKKEEVTTTTEKADDATTTVADETTTTVEGADTTTTTNAAANDGQSEQNTTTKAPASTDVAKDDGGSLAWLWIVLGAVVVIGGGAALYFLVIKKSGK